LPKYAVVRQVEEGRETSWGERGRLRSERLLQRERERERERDRKTRRRVESVFGSIND